jgi:hypothetical protein
MQSLLNTSIKTNSHCELSLIFVVAKTDIHTCLAEASAETTATLPLTAGVVDWEVASEVVSEVVSQVP